MRWSAEFHHSNGTTFTALTSNLSSDGLYCLLEPHLEPGERIECVLEIPRASQQTSDGLVLSCQLIVVHVHPAENRFGTGFHIEQYSVLRERLEPERHQLGWIASPKPFAV